MALQTGRSWQKILYKNQNVPDNYVDKSFLLEMKKNCTSKIHLCQSRGIARLWLYPESSRVREVKNKPLDRVCLFVVAFIYMHDGDVTPQTLCTISSGLAFLGYLINISIDDSRGAKHSRTVCDDAKTTVIFVAFGVGLSPVLMTLTDTISTDTIYAMTAVMLLAHLLFHDYGASTAIVSQSLSLNAAIFASVCLASRLPSPLHAFTTVSLALEIFALWPSLRKKLKKSVHGSQVALTVLLGLGTLTALSSVSSVGAILFLLGHIFITFICPAWLISLQPYKKYVT